MTIIASADVAKQLPAILQAIASGEEFLVTEAGRPVARITAPALTQPDQVLSGEAWQKELDEWRREARSRADRYPPGFQVDTSYEAIYGERENAQR